MLFPNMALDNQDCLSISTEENDDVIVEAPYKNLARGKPTSKLSPEQTSLMSTFPWMLEFTKLSQAEIGNINIRGLEKLIKYFTKQVIPTVRECYSRPNRATKLKRVMANTLLFFHMTYLDFKPPLEHSSYLTKMSDLMAMYLDMEIKASRTGTESLPKIASKLTSCLHLYFGRSYDHIIDTILKSKIMSKNFWELSDLLFRRVLRDSPSPTAYIFSYIRYLLAFKMWKGIMKEPDERKNITQLATVKLTPPEGFREKMLSNSILRDLLPRVPKSRTDVTAFFMQAKFPVREKIKMFLKAVQDPKLQCVLDRHIFNEAFPINQEESESSSLMNDIWSSMNIESGMRDPLGLGKIENKSRKLKNMAKLSAELLKKRRKKAEAVEEVGEDDKPVCETVVVDDDDGNDEDSVKLEVEGEDTTHPVCETVVVDDEISDGNDENSVKLEVEQIPLEEFSVERLTGAVCVSEAVTHEEIIPSPRVPAVKEESEVGLNIASEVPSEFSPASNNCLKIDNSQSSFSKETFEKNALWTKTDLQTYYNNVNFDFLGDNSKDEYIVVDEQPLSCEPHQKLYEVLANGTEEIDILNSKTSHIEAVDNVEVEKISTPPSIEVALSPNDNECSMLPLKKRKAFSCSNSSETVPVTTSYPATPMLSIAEVEFLGKFYNAVDTTLSPENVLIPNYAPPFTTHLAYPSMNSVIVQTGAKLVPPEPTLIPEQAFVPGAFTDTYLRLGQVKKCKPVRPFKTPAELKEFATNTSKAPHCEPVMEYLEPSKRQTRQKSKSQSRKRKRT